MGLIAGIGQPDSFKNLKKSTDTFDVQLAAGIERPPSHSRSAWVLK